MDDEPTYDLILRDPDGGILDRWPLNHLGLPCRGDGRTVSMLELWDAVVDLAQQDMRARER